VLAGAFLFVVLAVLVAKGGHYSTTVWSPLALIALLLAALAGAVQFRVAGMPATGVLVTIGALTAYVLWCFASIGWSYAKDAAWLGSNRDLLYLGVFVCAAVLPWRAVTAAALLACLSAFVAGIGVFDVAMSVHAADPSRYFQVGRLAGAFGYQNAACACFLMAFWPAILVASSRGAKIVVRALALGVACVLPELALLSQSRTSLVATPVTLLVYLLLVPRRARTLVTLAIPAVALLLTRGRLLDVFPALRSGEHVSSTLAAARDALALSAMGGVGAGIVLAVADRYLTARRLRRAGRLAVLVGAAVATIFLVVAGSLWLLRNPERRIEHSWASFKQSHPVTGASYFSSGLGSNRYDFWRVALIQFKRQPLHGVGVDNFADDYLRLRRSNEEPLYPHSLEIMVLSQTGVVGAVLFSGFFGGILLAFRRLRGVSPGRRGVIGAAAATSFYWALHGSVDWFWEVPALTGFAMACLGICVALLGPERSSAALSRRGGRMAVAVAASSASLAAFSILPPWLSAAEVARAADGWGADPALAYRQLDAALWLNPLSAEPDRIAGAIASRLHDWPRMRAAFSLALVRDPRDWYSHLELAVAASQERRWMVAQQQIARARDLDPLEPVIAYVAAEVKARHVVSTTAVDRMFLERIRQ